MEICTLECGRKIKLTVRVSTYTEMELAMRVAGMKINSMDME